MRKKIIRTLFIAALSLIVCSCIEEYKLSIDTSDTAKYVVYGNINDQVEEQTIQISYSSSITEPRFIPLNDCEVSISDNLGNVFESYQNDQGYYKVYIPEEYLQPGKAFKLDILTPNGDQITSDYDTLYQCASLDTVYYSREDIPSDEFGKHYEKVQFHINMEGSQEHSAYYVYTMEETWEYHTKYLKEWYFNGRELIHIDPPDSSTHICWKTQSVPNIYILSTEYLEGNSYTNFPLHHVTNQTEKLVYGYSLKVTQHATSKSTFNHFRKLRNNISSEGGLYMKQPEQVQGNLYHLTRPGDEVLGYFFVSSTQSKRIFVDRFEDMEMYYSTMCFQQWLRFGLRSLPPHGPPTYLLNGASFKLSEECVDCTVRGGTTIKPDFWPK
ncbi:MAG: DUF4249 domain-containing protein [Bacteroidales bacterium]|jgi:hypothetical protein|nr:DUF4249 domain-containing protein [Bacteroidales bacterium]